MFHLLLPANTFALMYRCFSSLFVLIIACGAQSPFKGTRYFFDIEYCLLATLL
jgi:hypothetical protein